MGRLSLTLVFSIISLAGSFAFAQKVNPDDNAALESKMERLWQDSSRVFYSPKSNLFYTAPLTKVPSPAEIAELKPLKKNGMTNWHGGGSGIEDCSMLGGIVLAGLCDRYEVLKDADSKARAAALFKGLVLAATAHGDEGFIARGVSPDDCKSVYPGSSRDQYTHSIHGMWRYYKSPMSSSAEKAQIRKIFSAVADKMTREVREDGNPPYSFKFYKGMPDDRGVGKMLDVYPHEAARLAMFYAAAYDVTKRPEYFELYRKHLPYALTRTAELPQMPEKKMRSYVPAYSILQMEASLELLYVVEKNKKLKKQIGGLMDMLAEFVENSPVFDLSKRKYARDCAEVINGQLLSPGYKLTPKHEKILRDCIARVSGSHDSGSSYTLLAAYWRARLEGKLNP